MTALPADDLVVRPTHLQLALNCSDRTMGLYLQKGHIPPPDGRSMAGLKLWKLSTIRAWNPAIARDIERLLALPTFAPRPQRVWGSFRVGEKSNDPSKPVARGVIDGVRASVRTNIFHTG